MELKNINLTPSKATLNIDDFIFSSVENKKKILFNSGESD